MTQSPDEFEEMNRRFFERLNAVRDDRAFRVALAQNVAANGRFFCALLAAANFADGFTFGVACAAVPVGFAWWSDIAKGERLKRELAIASITTAIGLAIATLVKCW